MTEFDGGVVVESIRNRSYSANAKILPSKDKRRKDLEKISKDFERKREREREKERERELNAIFDNNNDGSLR